MNQKALGFKIKELIELQDWKVMEVGADVPLEKWINCPGGCGELRTISTIVGNGGKQKIRVGCCGKCGYVGYIDRPTEAWINKFYSDVWDNSTAQNIDSAVLKFKERAARNNFGRKTEIPLLVEKIKNNIDKDRYICEIGCGFGHNLRQLELKGFTKIVGLEASIHRAEIAKRVYNFNIFTAPFQDSSLQNELKKKAPFSLVFAYHVLEHTYDPGHVVDLISNMQNPGDYIIFSVPNVEGEVSMATLMFLPHLHAFSPLTMERMLNKFGYEVVDRSLTGDRLINFVARKNSTGLKADKAHEASRDYYEKRLAKFSRSLDLDKDGSSRDRRFWWFRKFDIGRQVPFYANATVEKIHWNALRPLNKYIHGKSILKEVGFKRYFNVERRMISLIVNDVADRVTSAEESPIEIQYGGNIKLFFT